MTKQNVVVSDAKGVPIAVTVKEQSLFPSPPGDCITISRNNNKLQRLETATWLDSMRASSPPRNKSNTASNESWAVRHPSALSMFEQITNASKGKKIVMFLDYDGTLSPIVENPEKAFMSKEMRNAVRAVARYFPTAIVSGRCRDKVHSFVKLSELYYAGSHGMDIKGPSKCRKYMVNSNEPVLCQPATEFLPMVDEVYTILLEKTKSIPGSMVEHNKFCISVHFRCVDEKSWVPLAEEIKLVLDEYPKLRLTEGRKVLEIRPTIKWDKGKALEFLLESLGYANSNEVFPVYIGDDRTDEDAFKVLRDREQGFGILVSKVPKDTNASYSLQEPSEVKDFLRRLVKWKRSSMRKQY